MRLDPGKTTPVQVAKVPAGRDVQKLDATQIAGTRIVTYERYSCNFRVTRRDIVRVVGRSGSSAALIASNPAMQTTTPTRSSRLLALALLLLPR